MDWFLNNLETVVVPIIIVILYGLGNASQKKANREREAQKESQEPTDIDPGEARRVEQIQEEIRRKIAERTGRVIPPPPPKPVSQPATLDRPHYSDRDRSPQMPPATIPSLFDEQAHQKEIELKLRKVRELEGAIKGRKPKGQLRKDLFGDLSHPLGQKKAILIGEILGSPVGIKGPACWKANV